MSSLDTFANRCGTAVQCECAIRVVIDAHLRSDDHFVAQPFERCTDKLFVVGDAAIGKRAEIAFCRVEEIIAVFVRSVRTASSRSTGIPIA